MKQPKTGTLKTANIEINQILEAAQVRHPHKCKHKNPTNGSLHEAVKKGALKKHTKKSDVTRNHKV